jgi:SAM-dependent methyltransferase
MSRKGAQLSIEDKVRQCYAEEPFPNHLSRAADFGAELKKHCAYFAFIMKYLEAPAPGPWKPKTVLVAGCGTGEELLALASIYKGAKFTGLDLNPKSVAIARKNARRAGLKNAVFRLQSILKDLPKSAGSYDLVFCSGVIHHLEDPYLGFQILSRKVKPGGRFVISLYHSYGYFFYMAKRRLLDFFAGADTKRRAELALKLRLHYTKKAVFIQDTFAHPQVKAYSVRTVMDWAEGNGYEVAALSPPLSLRGFLDFVLEGRALLSGGRPGITEAGNGQARPAAAAAPRRQHISRMGALLYDLLLFALRKGECFYLLRRSGGGAG